MELEVLRATEHPEKLICQAGRGDMYAEYVGDTEYGELMRPVDYSEEDVERTERSLESGELHPTHPNVRRAKTRAFIRKQADRGHWGIWEHPSITFTVRGMSRVTMAQITRHRHMSFDIQSMRYVDFSGDADVVVPNSLTEEDHFSREQGLSEISERTQDRMKEVYERQVEQSVTAYENMVDAGVPKEDARYILPLGTTVNVTFSGNARTMLHVLNLRQTGSAQWEIRELSELIVDELHNWIPHTAEWWEEKGPMKISP